MSVLSSGDTVKIHPGLYQEQVTLPYFSTTSGTTTIENDGSSGTVYIEGTKNISGFSAYSGGTSPVSGKIWQLSYTPPTNQLPQEVLDNGTWLPEIGQEVTSGNNNNSDNAWADESATGEGGYPARIAYPSTSAGLAQMVSDSFNFNVATNTLYIDLPIGTSPTNDMVTQRDLWMTSGYSGGDYDTMVQQKYNITGLTFEYSNGGAYGHGGSGTYTDNYLEASLNLPRDSTVQNCTLEYSGYAGVAVSQDSTIANNVVSYNGSDGIIGQAKSSNFTIDDNTIQNNNYRHYSVTWGADGIKLISSGTYGGYEEGNIYGNDISYNNCGAFWSDTNSNSSSNELNFYGNYVHDNSPVAADYEANYTADGEAAIKIEISQYVRIYNNVIANNYNGVLLAASAHTEVYDNTFIGNRGMAAFQAGQDPSRKQNGNDEPVAYDDFQNNVLYNNYTEYDELFVQSTTEYGDGSLVAYDNTSDHNLFYRFGGPLQLSDGMAFGGLNGKSSTNSLEAAYTNLSTWNTATGWDADSIEGSPSFSTASGSQYIPGNNSYADYIGVSTLADGSSAPTTDYNGSTRSTTNIGVGALAASASAGPGDVPIATSPEAWVDDTLPTGAVPYSFLANDEVDPISWVESGTANQKPFDDIPASAPPSGELALMPDELSSNGAHAMLFTGATQTMTVSSTDTLEADVYVDPSDVPSEIMIHYEVGSTWYRAYWGADDIMSFGYENSSTTVYPAIGSIPAAGGWVKLTFSPSQVGSFSGAVSGLALVTYNGQAAWDDIGEYAPTPVPPSNLMATAGTSSIKLTWTDNSSNESGFDIYRSTTAGSFSGSAYATAAANATSYTDSSLGTGTTYYYQVEAYHTGYSNSAPATATNGSTEVTGRLNLAGVWDFEDPTNSTLISDGSGDGNVGTIQGAGAGPGVVLTSGSGIVGDGGSFSGNTGSYVSIPAASGSSLAPSSFNQITVEAWVYVSRYASSSNDYSGVDKSGSYGLLERSDVTGATGNAPAWEFYVGGSSDAISSSYTAYDSWYFIVGTWGGAEPGIHVFSPGGGETSNYVTYSSAVTSNSSPLNIGLGGTSAYFRGSIDEVEVVMGRELTSTEIAADYAAGESGFHPAAVKATPAAAPGATSSDSTSSISTSDSFDSKKKQSLVSEAGLE